MKSMIFVILAIVAAPSFAFDRIDSRVLERYQQHYKNVVIGFCVDESGTTYRTSYEGGSRADRKFTMSLVESVLSAKYFSGGCYTMKGSEWGEVRRASPN